MSVIDTYLKKCSPEDAAALQKVRVAVLAVAPDAKEQMVYGVPGFRMAGFPLAGFSAGKKFLSFYPMSGAVVAAHREQLEGFETTDGSVHFSAKQQIPVKVLKSMVKARIALEATKKAARKPAKKR